jgi:ATP-dependent helicase/nuclease subunit A
VNQPTLPGFGSGTAGGPPELDGCPPELAGAEGRALTDEQEEAVRRRAEPLLLSAGAGSGKTSVLVERFVRAVLIDGVAAGRILAITFTDRAAGELRERVRARFLELGQREAARETEAAFVSTFHGFCARLLRAHPLAAGVEPDFTVLDEGLAGRLRERAFRSALAVFLEAGEGPEVDLAAAYGVDQLQAMLLGVHAQLRSSGSRFPRLPLPALEEEAGQTEIEAGVALGLLDRLLAGFSRAYEKSKRERGALDFDDLELLARELLDERPGVRAAWSERFLLLMVDEFQDTNPRQLAILRALDTGNLFTVGDELQSIYGFRHAEVELFRRRRAELALSGASLTLRRNFRSREPILAAVNALFAGRMGEGFTSLVAGRQEPEPGARGPAAEAAPVFELLLTAREGWEDPELARALGEGLPGAASWRHAEARALAQRIHELIGRGQASPGEVVVLLRALGDVSVYERALQLQGLSTIAMVGSFWERLQTRDLLAYLRALANPLDEIALYETLASPLAGLSSDGLALLAGAARSAGRGVWDAAAALAAGEPGDAQLQRLSGSDRERLLGCITRLREERRAAPSRPIARLLERAMEASGYREHVLGLDWGERRLANVEKLLRLARRFEAGEGRDLRGFLDYAERLRDQRGSSEPDAPVDSVEPDAVRLMTIHAAKGLEFPVVCVADLGRQPGGRAPRLLVDGQRAGLSLVRLDGARAIPALDYAALLSERRRSEGEEEDRIMYVAMTRARERLLLSGAVEFGGWPQERENSPPVVWLGRALAGGLALPLDAGPAVCDLEFGPPGKRASVHCRLNSAGTLGKVLVLGDRPPVPGTQPPRGLPDDGPAAEAGALDASQRAPRPASSEPAPAAERPRAASGPPVPQRSPQPSLTTLSYTSLSLLERCGYRYYLERVLGLPEDRAGARRVDPGRGLEARVRGILVHGLLERVDFAQPQPPAPADVELLAGTLGAAVGAGECAEIAGLIAASLGTPLTERLGSARRVRREHPFAFRLAPGEPLVTGVIDLLAAEPSGGLLVLDYKSDRVGPGEDLQALVERDYGLQRALYALALLRDGAARVEVVHWFLERPLEPVSRDYGSGDAERLGESLGLRLREALANGFAVSESPHRALCLTCPGRAALCSWGETETLGEISEERPPRIPQDHAAP